MRKKIKANNFKLERVEQLYDDEATLDYMGESWAKDAPHEEEKPKPQTAYVTEVNVSGETAAIIVNLLKNAGVNFGWNPAQNLHISSLTEV